MIQIYEEKENLKVDESIPMRKKITANDMNQLRDAVLQSVYKSTATLEELSTAENIVLKDIEGNVLDPTLPLNLITNGPAVKTGFKRNGHDVYVKEFSAPVAVGDYKTIPIPGLANTDILCNWDAFIAKEGAGDIRVKAGFFATPSNFFSIHPNGKNISVFLGQETDWVGTGKKIYIIVWYEKVE